MKAHRCEDCGRQGRLGNINRVYVITTPLAVTDKILCFRCYEKRAAKRRKHVSIQDKVHV